MKALLVAVATLLVACTDSGKPPVVHAPAPQPKWMVDQKPVQIPPELKKLAETEDPDLKKQMTPAEVRAALAAAQQHEPQQQAQIPTLNVASDGEMSKLSEQQKRRNEAYQRALDQIVYVGPDNYYHTAMCASLQLLITEGGITRTRFLGVNTTVRAAKAAGKTRHADCGAPAADYTYQ